MKKKYIIIVLMLPVLIYSQNLLDYNTWKSGSNSVIGFSNNGAANENSREWAKGPFNNNVLIWKASPDSSINADGGWNTSYISIDSKKTYRFAVWIKKPIQILVAPTLDVIVQTIF